MQGRVRALPDGGADGYAEGTCANPDDAARAAGALRALVAEKNGPIARILLHGLLDGVAIISEGATVKLHVPATREQLESVLALATAGGLAEAHP
jgi:hypothetical protein